MGQTEQFDTTSEEVGCLEFGARDIMPFFKGDFESVDVSLKQEKARQYFDVEDPFGGKGLGKDLAESL